MPPRSRQRTDFRSEEHTSELQSRLHLVCRLLLEKKNRTVRLVPICSVIHELRHPLRGHTILQDPSRCHAPVAVPLSVVSQHISNVSASVCVEICRSEYSSDIIDLYYDHNSLEYVESFCMRKMKDISAQFTRPSSIILRLCSQPFTKRLFFFFFKKPPPPKISPLPQPAALPT